ncbi:MAG: hypothetical protein E7671_02385 [Ruminococcaceae bacterium]|nr:hypothetical protein [Oscillospiraceae bacterium]
MKIKKATASFHADSRLRKTVIIQSVVILALCIAIIAVSFGYFGQMRLNHFSKNIIFSDNYFLRNFAHAYLPQTSSMPLTYTVSEAEALTRNLVGETGLLFLENSWIFAVYRPARELNKMDILAYYYNYLISMFVSQNELYALFSPEINELIPIEGNESVVLFSQFDVISHISKLVEYSFEWTPLEINYIDKVEYSDDIDVIYSEYESFEDYESYLIRFEKLKRNIVALAEQTLNSDTEHGAEYTAEEIYMLYYDSIAESLLSTKEYLSAGEVLDLLEEYEYGNIRPRILDAEHISQLPEYPNGCEAVSAVMLLKYAGYGAEKSDFIENYLEKGDMKIRFGIRFGPNPVKKYAGDPASKSGGWGCFAPVIVNALESYLAVTENSTHRAFNVSGAELSVLCETFIDRSIPVAIWITQDSSPVSEVYQWLDYGGDQVYLYPSNQHCVMLIGYDKDNYYVCDPLKDEEYTAIARADVELSYTSMGSQAVVLMPNEE